MASDEEDDASSSAPLSAGTVVRLFVEVDLAAGAEMPLEAPRAHYLRNVLRRQAGDAVTLFNGRDGEWRARLSAEGRRAHRLVIG